MRRSKLLTVATASMLVYSATTIAEEQNPINFWAIYPWEMWAATPSHKKLCKENGRCYSLAILFPKKDILQWQDNDRWSVLSILPSGGIGIIRDYGDGALRCFSETLGNCSPALYPPGYSPGYAIIPVLADFSINTATPGAQIHYSFKTEHVNYVILVTCSAVWMGSIIHSGSHFLLSSYDFGPPIGVLNNIYVTEEAMGCPLLATNPMHCQRLERYYFAPSIGRIRQEGWNDPLCDGANPEICLGNYSIAAPGVESWKLYDGPPVPFTQSIEGGIIPCLE